MQFGLPYQSLSPEQRRGESEDRQYSYSTSIAELKTRAIAGCLWCQLLIARLDPHGEILRDPSKSDAAQTIKVSGDTWARGPQALQEITIWTDSGHTAFFKGIIHTTSDDPAASNIVMRSPILDVGTPCALALAKECIDQCVREHELCKAVSAFPDPLLPTRLVDCDDPAKPRLVSTAGQRGRYLALSYVWGEEQPYRTTTANILEYEQGIEACLLPQTIRDAICVTHALGFRFLWADTLCVLQDQDEDKRHELEHMHQIYRHASVTITAASAAKVSEGFLHNRPPPPQFDFSRAWAWPNGDIILPFICYPTKRPLTSVENPLVRTTTVEVGTVRITPIFNRGGADIDWPFSNRDILGPITTRGWCMQEDLISPRSLVFSPETLQFRCQTTLQNVGSPLSYVPPIAQIPRMLFLPDPPPARDLHQAWRAVVRDYSARVVSDPLDKLVACAALAEYFSRVLRSDYLAGLWRDMLLFNLLWRRSRLGAPPTLHRPVGYRAPSWSWAAVDGGVDWWEVNHSSDAVAEVVECKVALEHRPLLFGRVTGGILVLHAAVLQCRLSSPKSTDILVPGRLHRMVLQSQVQRQWLRRPRGAGELRGDLDDDDDDNDDDQAGQLVGQADIDYDAHDARIASLWAVPLICASYEPSVDGLVVTLADPNSSESECGEPVYRRVGTFSGLGLKRPSRYHCHSEMSKDASPTATRELVRALKTREYPMADIRLV